MKNVVPIRPIAVSALMIPIMLSEDWTLAEIPEELQSAGIEDPNADQGKEKILKQVQLMPHTIPELKNCVDPWFVQAAKPGVEALPQRLFFNESDLQHERDRAVVVKSMFDWASRLHKARGQRWSRISRPEE